MTKRMARRNAGEASRRRAGFSLVELILVIGLLAIMAGIAMPAILNQIYHAHLPESAERFRSALRMARSSAQMNSKRYRIRFDPGAQQPIIERQSDPVVDPNLWEVVDDLWAKEPLMSDDVQVVNVRIGRPQYMVPISHTLGDTDESEFQLEFGSTNDDQVAFDEVDDSEMEFDSDLDQPEEDEFRRAITFDIDGTCDWYTVIIARVEPAEEIDPEVRQIWIVLDGRTGLPEIREPMTEDEIWDEASRPDLDKLEPPPTELDEAGLTVDPTAGLLGQDPAMQGGNAGDGGADGGGGGGGGI